jgi:hypothetical protein
MIEEMEIKVRNLLQEVGVPWTADLRWYLNRLF